MAVYPNVRETGVSWLAQIPEHWELKKIDVLFSERKTIVSDKDFAPLSVTKKGILPQLEHAAKSNDSDNRKLVKAGDFVINSRSDRKGSCGVSPYDGSVSLINIVLTPRNELNSNYVHYLLHNYRFSEEYYRNGRGIVADLWTTRYSEMRTILLPVPSRSEQDLIVRFLNWKVSEINKLIEIRRKEIQELDELEAHIIDKAVIHGLHGDAERHNDDIRWDIDYPTTWELERFRNLFSFRKGLSITKANLEPTGIPVISYGQVHSKKNSMVSLNDELFKYINPSYLRTDPTALVKKGDFIFADTSEDLGGSGNCAYIDRDEEVFAGYHSVIAHPKGGIDNKYFAYLFKSPTWRYQIRKRVNAVKVYSITQQILKDLFLLVPPQEEQQEIVRYLDSACSKIDFLIESTYQKIAELTEMKAVIISDVVTGKIEVRNIAVPEYEHVDDIADDGSEADEEVDETETDEERNEHGLYRQN